MSGDRSVVTLRHGDDAATAVVLFPHSGCHARTLEPVAASLETQGSSVLAIDYPGRGARAMEPLASSLDELAQEVAGALSRGRHRHLVLFGHSFGAVLAFEVAQRLGPTTAVECFVASSCISPFALAAMERHVHELSDDDFTGLLRKHGGVPPELQDEPELLEYIVPIVRHDTRLGEQHQPVVGSRISAPIIAVGGDTDATVSAEDLGAWADCTTSTCEIRFLQGGHFHVVEHPDNVGRLLGDVLRRTAPYNGREVHQ
jgi:surfactin synthase thioesterase subunit